MYCCIWCHTELSQDEAFVTEKGRTVCSGCRGLGIVLNKWNQRCDRHHVVRDTGQHAS